MHTDSEFAIIGGGVAGLATAIMLKGLNREFTLFERVSKLQGIGAGFGLAANAMQALELLGLRQDVEELGYYLDSFAILNQDGEILVKPNTQNISKRYEQQNFAIHRADLHLYLLSQLAQDQLVLGKSAQRIEKSDDHVKVFFEDGTTHTCKYLIVADGIKSPIRQQLLPASQPRYSGYTCWRATINNCDIKLKKGTETWGKHGRFGMTPLKNDRIYWYACINGPANSTKFQNYTIQDLQDTFKNYHNPIPEILAQTKQEQLIWNDIIDLKPLKQFAFDNILLIGDAAHACTPNMGQGACQALEDVAVIQDELRKNKSVKLAFQHLENRRLARTKYIIDTSRSIGSIAQWENPIFIAIRNGLMKLMPPNMGNKALEKLFKENFMTINNE